MRTALGIGAALAIAAVFYLVGEGLLAVGRWNDAGHSLAYRGAQMTGLADARRPHRFARPVLEDPGELEGLLDDMEAHGVGLGNSPYDRLRTAAASTTERHEGCVRNVPDTRKIMTFLRTPEFETFNPIMMFYDADRPLPDRLQQFVDRYAVHPVRHSTDQWGQRRTLPEITADDIVLVAGDSVGNGAMVDDHQTLASVLQGRNRGQRYVNIAVGGADAAEIRCLLEAAAARYAARVDHLIYVYCENDFDEDEAMGTPEAVMEWLRPFVDDQRIPRTTVVYAPYIFNVMPSMTRVKGQRGERFEDHADEKARLIALVAAAGFDWIDFGAIALAEADRRGTEFGALALYVDVVHHSPAGIELLADAVAATAAAEMRPKSTGALD